MFGERKDMKTKIVHERGSQKFKIEILRKRLQDTSDMLVDKYSHNLVKRFHL